MEAISKIKLDELAPRHSEALKLGLVSPPRLDDATGQALALMMAQAQAAKPNQELPEGTPDMYLAEWEEMVVKYGLLAFREALLRALRDDDFFPQPTAIRDHCAAIARERRERLEAQKHIGNLDAWKAQWERERAEDLEAANAKV